MPPPIDPTPVGRRFASPNPTLLSPQLQTTSGALASYLPTNRVSVLKKSLIDYTLFIMVICQANGIWNTENGRLKEEEREREQKQDKNNKKNKKKHKKKNTKNKKKNTPVVLYIV